MDEQNIPTHTTQPASPPISPETPSKIAPSAPPLLRSTIHLPRKIAIILLILIAIIVIGGVINSFISL